MNKICKTVSLSCEFVRDDGGYKAFLFDPIKEFGEQHILQIDVEKVANVMVSNIR